MLGCGGVEPEPVEPEILLPTEPPPPPPPEIRSHPVPGSELEQDVVRRLQGAEGLIRRCLEKERGSIRKARQPVQISVDLAVSRVVEEVSVEVLRSGFGAPEVVERCVTAKIARVDLEGLQFDGTWQVVADFP